VEKVKDFCNLAGSFVLASPWEAGERSETDERHYKTLIPPCGHLLLGEVKRLL
jgi:hypothetical protein